MYLTADRCWSFVIGAIDAVQVRDLCIRVATFYCETAAGGGSGSGNGGSLNAASGAEQVFKARCAHVQTRGLFVSLSLALWLSHFGV
jgi:hypothetical protein